MPAASTIFPTHRLPLTARGEELRALLAQRIVYLDGAMGTMLQRHRLLVAGREGHYVPHEQHKDRILNILLPPGTEGVSSSEIRRLIVERQLWEHLVPSPIVALVRELYALNC